MTQETTVAHEATAPAARQIPKSQRALRREDEAARYGAARRAMEEQGIHIKHFRLSLIVPPACPHQGPGVVESQRGGITVAYRHVKNESFVEVATAICSDRDVYDRKVGTIVAVEQFVNLRRIRIPHFGEHPAKAVEQLFRGYTTFIDHDE